MLQELKFRLGVIASKNVERHARRRGLVAGGLASAAGGMK